MASDRGDRPQHLRRAQRLSNGTIVVAEYDSSGRLVRKTYYDTSDKALFGKIIEAGSNHPESPDAS
jgi:hypothetical protein